MLVDNSFDFTGIDILATGNDHVLQAVKDIEIAICILIAEVSCAKEAISEGESGLFLIVPIAAHDIRTPGREFTSTPALDLLSRLVHDLHIDCGRRSPTGQAPGRCVLVVFETGQ